MKKNFIYSIKTHITTRELITFLIDFNKTKMKNSLIIEILLDFLILIIIL